MSTSTGAVHEPSILQQKMTDNAVFCNITEFNLSVYTRRNVAFEVQKALVINIMATAVSKGNCGVIEKLVSRWGNTGYITEEDKSSIIMGARVG